MKTESTRVVDPSQRPEKIPSNDVDGKKTDDDDDTKRINKFNMYERVTKCSGKFVVVL